MTIGSPWQSLPNISPYHWSGMVPSLIPVMPDNVPWAVMVLHPMHPPIYIRINSNGDLCLTSMYMSQQAAWHLHHGQELTLLPSSIPWQSYPHGLTTPPNQLYSFSHWISPFCPMLFFISNPLPLQSPLETSGYLATCFPTSSSLLIYSPLFFS